MGETIRHSKRVQYIGVALIYGLGLLLALNFTWPMVSGYQLYLGEQHGYIAVKYGIPQSFFRTRYKTRNLTMLPAYLAQPVYREQLARGIPVDGLYSALTELSAVLGISDRAGQPTSPFMKSEFVIGLVIPCLLAFFSLLGNYYSIRKSQFTWWEPVVCVTIAIILMVILLPVTVRTRDYSDNTFHTWQALTLFPDAKVLDVKKFEVNRKRVYFVLYRLNPKAKERMIYSSKEILSAEGGDGVIVAIAASQNEDYPLLVSAVTFWPEKQTTNKGNGTMKLRFLKTLSKTGKDFINLSLGSSTPLVRYDVKKQTMKLMQE